eukprot:CAMPEP_0194115626 /NCGR_PEP_ID=MMETSP0150-20130528/24183_1 /TAXON_ID=122233 /ORGANISM="Chaetoceros debilis, Strain MM31A-1" /LENGTH=591 /DNA_ID=CAMNT_0038806157 /DNA_START=97 /DNA_END=1868 /DNA_ORIENTATION=-
MIRSRAAKSSRPGAPSSGGNQHYRSARAVAPMKRSKGTYSRLNWKVLKMMIFLIGAVVMVVFYQRLHIAEDLTTAGSASESGSSISSGNGGAQIVSNAKRSNAERNFKSERQGRSLARGISGLPLSETPALVGGSRGHIQCEVDVDELVYWNDPQGTRDVNFQSPFTGKSHGGDGEEKTKYLTFEPDRGGWNNIRMNLENVFILAAATGRTLVMPPAVPVYLLTHDKEEKHKGFADFYNLYSDEFQHRVKIISTEEFITREGGEDGQFPILESKREEVLKSSIECDKRAKSDISCDHIWEYLESKAFVPQFNGTTCLIFDEDSFEGQTVSSENAERVKSFCGEKRIPYYITEATQEEQLIHLKNAKGWRIMAHYYGYMYFTNTAIFNYYKRFVRDFMHYHDEIYCAAGKIILALQLEGEKLGFKIDEEGGGGFSSMHVRRGDLQYKAVKISAEEWYDNLKDTWQDKEIIYIATDERNKTFFDPIKEHNNVKFLDDYWDYADLGKLDGNYMGMIDTIIASRGRSFAGTFRSTFTGYINRMRGYHGMSMKDSYYGFLEKKKVTHEWLDYYDGTTFALEWPDGWIGIDGDVEPS